MVGYLEAFALAQMLPERAEAILDRAHAYAHNRIVCGVHYPTDVEASRSIALALFGALSTSPRFREELSAAKSELRAKLSLTP
jgi:acid phosphatase (class A)